MNTDTYELNCVITGVQSVVNDALNRALIDKDIPTDSHIEDMITHALNEITDNRVDEEVISDMIDRAIDGAVDDRVENIVDSFMCDYDFGEAISETLRHTDLYDFVDVHEIAELVDEINSDSYVSMYDYNRDHAALDERTSALESEVANLSIQVAELLDMRVNRWYTKLWTRIYSYVKGIR